VATVGIRELKDGLAEFLRRVRRGERVIITDREVPVAMLVPAGESTEAQAAWQIVREGAASWSGGKPVGSVRPAKSKGKTIAAKIIEDRR
jgi:prevent-host-death family protein